MTSNAENLLIHGIEQDRAAVDDWYSRLTEVERGELLAWINGSADPMLDPPDWVTQGVALLSGLAFMEAGYRWAIGGGQ